MRSTKIIGFPGTGKTTRLLKQVNTFLKSGAPPRDIAFISFTRAAAREAIDRIRKTFKDYSVKDFPHFRTLHSMCSRLLGLTKESFVTDKLLEEFCRSQNYYYNSKIVDDNPYEWIKGVDQPPHVFFAIRSYGVHKQYKSLRKTWNDYPGVKNTITFSEFSTFIEAYFKFKVEKDLYDYDDILLEVLHRKIIPPIKYLIVDEFQDFSPLMYGIFCHWEKVMVETYIAGDPYQAIYTFMGANPNFLQEHPTQNREVLPKSYRLPSNLLHTIQHLISDPDLASIEAAAKGGLARKEHSRRFELINRIDPDVSTFLLVRANWFLKDLIKYLIGHGVIFYTYRGHSPWSRKLINFHNAFLKFLAKEDLTLREVRDFLDYFPVKGFIKRGVKSEIEQALKGKKVCSYSRTDPNIIDFKLFKTVFLKEITEDLLLRLLNSKKMGSFKREAFLLRLDKTRELIDPSKINLRLGTIHSVKGKEADKCIVFLDITERIQYDASIEDEERVWFVAMSRARKELVLVEKWFSSDYQFDFSIPDLPHKPEIIEIKPQIQIKTQTTKLEKQVWYGRIEGLKEPFDIFQYVWKNLTTTNVELQEKGITADQMKFRLPYLFEEEIEDILQQLLEEGNIFEPRTGFFKPI